LALAAAQGELGEADLSALLAKCEGDGHKAKGTVATSATAAGKRARPSRDPQGRGITQGAAKAIHKRGVQSMPLPKDMNTQPEEPGVGAVAADTLPNLADTDVLKALASPTLAPEPSAAAIAVAATAAGAEDPDAELMATTTTGTVEASEACDSCWCVF
jgi:hypothetical protein